MWPRWMWFLLPMGAAMQLAAVTSHLSQDVAAIPLLWILPLATYLLTFIVAFEMPWLYRRWIVARLMAVLLAGLGYALTKLDTRLPLGLAVIFYLVEVFVACWFCHAEAYRLRPAESEGEHNLLSAGGSGRSDGDVSKEPRHRKSADLSRELRSGDRVPGDAAVLAAMVTWEQGRAQRLLWTFLQRAAAAACDCDAHPV